MAHHHLIQTAILEQPIWCRFRESNPHKKYLAGVGLFLFVYAYLVWVLAVLSPSMLADQAVFSDLTLGDRLGSALRFLVFGQTTWPALMCVLVPVAVMGSLFLKHRHARQLNGLIEGAEHLERGDLSARFHAAEGDGLHGLPEKLNRAVTELDRAFREIRDREARERNAIRQYLNEMKRQPSANHGNLEQLELALKEGEYIDAVLKGLRVSGS